MSNSLSKYHDMLQDQQQVTPTSSEHQRGVVAIVEILQAAKKAKMRSNLLKQVLRISSEAPQLSPSTVFQIAADEVKIDELCGS